MIYKIKYDEEIYKISKASISKPFIILSMIMSVIISVFLTKIFKTYLDLLDNMDKSNTKLLNILLIIFFIVLFLSMSKFYFTLFIYRFANPDLKKEFKGEVEFIKIENGVITIFNENIERRIYINEINKIQYTKELMLIKYNKESIAISLHCEGGQEFKELVQKVCDK